MENPTRTNDFLHRRQAEVEEVKRQLSTISVAPIVLELGCGHGHFLTAYAELKIKELNNKKENKEKINFIAVDKNEERIARAQLKSDRAGLNIKWLAARVEDVLEYWPENLKEKIEETFVLFPDPWPKAKQQKNRFVNEDFLQKLSKIMQKNGKFYFRTDHPGYFEEVEKLMNENGAWKIDKDAAWPEGLPATVFEGHHPVYQSLISLRQ